MKEVNVEGLRYELRAARESYSRAREGNRRLQEQVRHLQSQVRAYRMRDVALREELRIARRRCAQFLVCSQDGDPRTG